MYVRLQFVVSPSASALDLYIHKHKHIPDPPTTTTNTTTTKPRPPRRLHRPPAQEPSRYRRHGPRHPYRPHARQSRPRPHYQALHHQKAPPLPEPDHPGRRGSGPQGRGQERGGDWRALRRRRAYEEGEGTGLHGVRCLGAQRGRGRGLRDCEHAGSGAVCAPAPAARAVAAGGGCVRGLCVYM